MKLSILVVEDEAVQALALGAALKELGHQVAALARDGEEACLLRAQLNPDLVVMDIQLPRLDGLSAAVAMNQSSPLPVILITAVNDHGFVERAADAGVYGFLVKPVDRAALGTSIELAWQGFQRVRALSRQVVELEDALRARKLIERAKGILMDRYKLSEPQAMTRLQQESRRQSLPMADIAQSVVASERLLDPRRR